MFASQQHRRFAVGEYLRGGGLYRLYRRGGVAEGQVEVSRVKYAEIIKISVLIGAVVSIPKDSERIAAGPKRVPGRKEVVESKGAPKRTARASA